MVDAYTHRIDRERRQHETAMTLYLFAAYARAARHSLAAVRLGHDPVAAALDVIVGHEGIEQPGIAIRVESLLSKAFAAGWRRAHLEGERGVNFDRQEMLDIPEESARAVREGATQYAHRAANAIRNGLAHAISKAAKGVRGVLSAVRAWWKGSGYVLSDGKGGAKTVAAGETLAIAAYNNGADAGYALQTAVLGFGLNVTLDNGTTTICRPLFGVKLPPDHPWWARHRPPLHWGCRTVRYPIYEPFAATRYPPEIDPAPGFGSGLLPV